MRARSAAWIAACAALLAPAVASAHLVETGVGPFYDGAAHFFVSFEEILPVVALALAAGLRGPRAARWSVAALAAGWLAAGVAGLAYGPPAPLPLATTLLLLVPGALAAADRELPLAAVTALAGVLGAVCGFTSGGAMAASGAGLRGVLGAASAALLVALLALALVVGRGAGWPRIAIRVAGSWLVALGLLSLGWTLGPLGR